jgi:hypothetical protein
MNRLLKLILPISLLFALFNNAKAQQVTKKDYYEFYNSIISIDSSGKDILIKEADYYNLKRLLSTDSTNIEAVLDRRIWNIHTDPIFSKEDIETMKKQLLRDSNFKWSERKLKKKVRVLDAVVLVNDININSDSGWSSFRRKYGIGFSTFSIPLFSKYKSICVIYQSERCGSACGSGGFSIYKKQKGKWVFYRYYEMWIS